MDLTGFVTIPDYPDYLIDSSANVFSTKSNSLLKHYLNNNGYKFVGFAAEGKTKFILLHRLMASVYKGLDLDDPETEVHHKDHDKNNNNHGNLEIISKSAHATKHWDESGNRRQKKYCTHCGIMLYKYNKNIYCNNHRYNHQRVTMVAPIMETRKDFEILVDKFGYNMVKLASLFGMSDNGFKKRINKLK